MKDEKQDFIKAGGLVDSFQSALKKEINNKEIAAAMGDIDEYNPLTLPGGLMSKLGFTAAKIAILKKKKDDEWFMNFIFRELIRLALINIEKIISYHQEHMEELLKTIEESLDLLDLLNDNHSILETERRYFQDTGVFNLDECGRFKNPKAETIISEWEKRTGEVLDLNDPAAYETIFKIQAEIEKQRIELQNDIEHYEIEFEYHERKLDNAQKIKDGLESGDFIQSQDALMDFKNFTNDFGESDILVSSKEDLTFFEMELENLQEELLFDVPPLLSNFSEAASGQSKTIENTPSVPKIQNDERFVF